MSWISSAGCRDRRLRMTVVLAAALVGGGVPVRGAVAQDAAIMRWPRALESRAPALFSGIERDFGERPRMILFYGRDTLDVVFLSPGFWANDMEKKDMPQESLPIVSESAEHVAWYVWNNFARDAGINLLRITFVRMRRAHDVIVPDREVSAQQAFETFTRQWLETKQDPKPLLGWVQRDESWRQIEEGRYCLLAPKSTVLRCVGDAPDGAFHRRP